MLQQHLRYIQLGRNDCASELESAAAAWSVASGSFIYCGVLLSVWIQQSSTALFRFVALVEIVSER